MAQIAYKWESIKYNWKQVAITIDNIPVLTDNTEISLEAFRNYHPLDDIKRQDTVEAIAVPRRLQSGGSGWEG